MASLKELNSIPSPSHCKSSSIVHIFSFARCATIGRAFGKDSTFELSFFKRKLLLYLTHGFLAVDLLPYNKIKNKIEDHVMGKWVYIWIIWFLYVIRQSRLQLGCYWVFRILAFLCLVYLQDLIPIGFKGKKYKSSFCFGEGLRSLSAFLKKIKAFLFPCLLRSSYHHKCQLRFLTV